MQETELKFQVPAARRAAVLKAVQTAGAQRTRLQAVYADTADHRLAKAGLALRLRKEGRRWVQTLKGRVGGAQGLSQRLEHEVLLGAAEPQLDVRRHAGTPVGEQLLALLADGAPLIPLYRTDIQRVHRELRSGGAVLELAYDRGHIAAGEQSVPVDELEFELRRGPAAALPALAQRWVQRFGLWWDIRTKSERGFRLALGQTDVPPRLAGPVPLSDRSTPGQALAAALGAALEQVLANAAAMASGAGTADHLHQLRVGLRRMRSLLRTLGSWAADPAAAAALEADWREPFAALGARRDHDVLLAQGVPALLAAGAPPLLPPVAVVGSDPDDVVRGPAFGSLALRSLALVMALEAAPPGPPDVARQSLAAAAGDALRPLLRQVRRSVAALGKAGVEDRHRLRKRLKRLRYTLDALKPLLKRRAEREVFKPLRRALAWLGELNDLATAEAAYAAQVQADPRSWFAVGWLRARQDMLLARADSELRPLRALKLPWR